MAVASKGTETKEEPAPTYPVSGFWVRIFEHTDSLVYILVGICFFLAALLSLFYGIAKFGYSAWGLYNQQGVNLLSPTTNGAELIITFVSDLLLTLIIMEVLSTVVQYLRTRETSLRPFLFIGIVSATRGILAVGARISVSEGTTFKPDDFRDAMIELAINAAVIIALGVTMRLINDFLGDRSEQQNKRAATNSVRQPDQSSQRTIQSPTVPVPVLPAGEEGKR